MKTLTTILMIDSLAAISECRSMSFSSILLLFVTRILILQIRHGFIEYSQGYEGSIRFVAKFSGRRLRLHNILTLYSLYSEQDNFYGIAVLLCMKESY